MGVGEGSSNQIVNGTPVANGSGTLCLTVCTRTTFFTLETGAGGTSEAGDTTLDAPGCHSGSERGPQSQGRIRLGSGRHRTT